MMLASYADDLYQVFEGFFLRNILLHVQPLALFAAL